MTTKTKTQKITEAFIKQFSPEKMLTATFEWFISDAQEIILEMSIIIEKLEAKKLKKKKKVKLKARLLKLKKRLSTNDPALILNDDFDSFLVDFGMFDQNEQNETKNAFRSAATRQINSISKDLKIPFALDTENSKKWRKVKPLEIYLIEKLSKMQKIQKKKETNSASRLIKAVELMEEKGYIDKERKGSWCSLIGVSPGNGEANLKAVSNEATKMLEEKKQTLLQITE